eukprot:760322-Hanusia_phi.AAC.1
MTTLIKFFTQCFPALIHYGQFSLNSDSCTTGFTSDHSTSEEQSQGSVIREGVTEPRVAVMIGSRSAHGSLGRAHARRFTDELPAPGRITRAEDFIITEIRGR